MRKFIKKLNQMFRRIFRLFSPFECLNESVGIATGAKVKKTERV